MLATAIPRGATAADLEQSFAAVAPILPEAVALIDTTDATFQDNRGLSAEVVTHLDAKGLGLVTFDRGQGKFRYDARVQFCFIVADDESQMELIWPGYGSDYTVPDKAIYKAITSGHKYFLAKLLCIGADNEDSEHETEANATLAGSVNDGPNTCPSCRAPVGKIHANNCQVPTPKTTVQPPSKQTAKTAAPKQDAPPADFTLADVDPLSFETDPIKEWAEIPGATPTRPDRPTWHKPADAYAWAIESGACANEFEAKNSLKKITDEQFGGKLTGNNLQDAFDRFHARQVEKLAAAAA
jgi:hypothetical protein